MTSRLETVMIYGKSGIGKSSQLYHLVKYYHKKFPKKVFRLVTAELGNNIAPFEDSGMIDEGIVELCDVSGAKQAFAVVKRLGNGQWPKEGVQQIESSGDMVDTPAEKWNNIGGYLIESMKSIGDLWKNHISDQVEYKEYGNDKGWQGVGFKPAYVHEEDGMFITGLQPGHFGIVQKEVHKLHRNLSSLPIKGGILAYTSLEARGYEDMESRKLTDVNWVPTYPIYGPAMVGSAATSSIPSWFKHTIHMDEIMLPKKAMQDGKEVMIPSATRVGWFISHADSEKGVNYLAKPRVLPELYPKLMERFKGGYVQCLYTRGLDKYFEFLEQMREEFQSQQKKGE